MFQNLTELYQYRVLLWSLTLRELKARYRGSVLGFLWTFLNPTLLMLVYALLFTVYMKQSLEHYTLFMFVGLLPWIWFSTSVGSGASAISDRRDLLTKVKFPPQVLPATVVLTNGINYALSLPLMVGISLLSGVRPTLHLLLLPLVALLQLLFTLGATYLVSALNVSFRDLQHVVNNLLTLAYFLTPVLYPVTNIPLEYRPLALYLNPMAGFVTAYQDLVYYHRLPDPGPLLSAGLVSVLLLVLASSFFNARREDFAELV
ncbi:ABC transporter permease [Aggregicoccus sp. 17bor-14]|uniref:ABC transporter permease n=1 Tax=Myxococcaceae TaxID=31 RepID=UPI00129CAD92|nr:MULTISPECIES: ABC transporter permease [Myxococcaceae]MBF5045585.1 ABC transporter permease [Simulacricoccus sp. 17bor-14]MRI91322.1 ABC transporter permease [Aggregicoccus sp. 17bor-14]